MDTPFSNDSTSPQRDPDALEDDDRLTIPRGAYQHAGRGFARSVAHDRARAATRRIAGQLHSHRSLVIAIVCVVIFWVALFVNARRRAAPQIEAPPPVAVAAAPDEIPTSPQGIASARKEAETDAKIVVAVDPKHIAGLSGEESATAALEDTPRDEVRPPLQIPEATVVTPPVDTDATQPSPSEDVTEGQLVLTTEPAGARVTVNGIGWGPTPVTIRYLPLGAKSIRVTMDGYASAQRTVHVEKDNPRRRLHIRLRSLRVTN